MEEEIKPKSFTDRVILFFIQNKLITFLWISFIIIFGFYVMPFELPGKAFRNPIPVDAIPDIGEKQVIVFADWPGRSPQDVENQVTYPLTITLQGIPGVKSVRSFSMFGFSTCFVIFRDNVEFYWARSRVLERLSIAQQRLPEGVIPYLGPDATALGQIFWYTVEGKGFDLQELRSIQDWYIRYALQSVEGVSEVASVGGYVKQYQIDVDPDAMRQYNVMLGDVVTAVKKSNIDVGAETIEFNGVEYIIRGKGFIKTIADIENIVIKEEENVPVFIKNIAKVSIGPALRRGILDKEGKEVVGGVVTCRYGENPLEVINRVKEKIKEIEPGLPKKILPDGSYSQVKIIPFYDRTQLIKETLNTLKDTLILEIIVTCFTVFLILNELLSSFIISFNLPLAILLSFGFMKIFGVQSNLMSLGGIAIAIGTMVDMGILLCENTVRHFSLARPEEKSLNVVYRSSSEIGSAVVTAISTTIVSFLPIFALTGPEGKLFKPLAYTKTFALFASVVLALTVIPTLCHLLLSKKTYNKRAKIIGPFILLVLGIPAVVFLNPWIGLPLIFAGIYFFVINKFLPSTISKQKTSFITGALASFYMLLLLTKRWMPLGLGTGFLKNFIIVLLPTSLWGFLAIVMIILYPKILRILLKRKFLFLLFPLTVTIFGMIIWLGFGKVFSFLPQKIKSTKVFSFAIHKFPGLGKEFMPPLDEGSFLFMPVTMPHASIGQAYDIIQKQDILIKQIPEIESVVGKLGRAETALDPAPINMIETFITYKPEYGPPDPKTGKRERLWRPHIKTPDDIWNEIVRVTQIPG
ncbi:MAG: efflux RND transporter permease subunit, partial [Candidatus Omnitrophica bacterium]|nr:efflux RND transporter permease subunit [Candidatus Omnitrophota bacterium]